MSRQTVRRPTRSELSQLSAAVRIRACLAAFSSTPSRPNTSMNADVQASPPVRQDQLAEHGEQHAAGAVRARGVAAQQGGRLLAVVRSSVLAGRS